MNRSLAVRAGLAIVLLAWSGYAALTTAPKLGLDLRGGTQIVLETRDGPEVPADSAATDRTLEVLRERADALGVAVLATLPRTVNTGLSTVMILVTLFVLGGDSLADFALALLLGIIVGTCSTVSLSAPLAVELESRRSASPPAPKRTGPGRRDAGAVV